MERKLSQHEIETIGDNVDRLISLDVGRGNLINNLYPSVRTRLGRPLCLTAAERLRDRVQPGAFVLISTGMLIHPFETLAETDGPLGAAALARALQSGLGAKPVILTDEAAIPMIKATCRGASLNVTDLKAVSKTERTVAVMGFPVEDQEAKTEAKKLIEDLSPKALIAIERRGRNRKGVYHAPPKGRNMNSIEAKMVDLFDEASLKGILTIGIGDGGNELGWGQFTDSIVEKMPSYGQCICGCGGGIADSTLVDVTVAASVSNWGAYGIAACLSVLLNNPEILHDERIESRMLRECIDAGGIDGASHLPEPRVDGLSEKIQIAIVNLLHEITGPGFFQP
jgi:D-glutamate cyclase